MIEARFVLLLISFLLGFAGTCGFFILLYLHKSWDKDAYGNFIILNRNSKILFVLACSAIGGLLAALAQSYYIVPVHFQSILIGFNWLTTPITAKIN